MPRVEISVKTAGGQTIVLSEGDRLEKLVTIECNSKRCASRNGQDKPKEVSIIEGQEMPESGDQWMSLILPDRSPQHTPLPPNFCSSQCVRDFLVYDYIAPTHRATPETVPSPVTEPNYQGVKVESFSHPVIPQADGDPGDTHGV